MNKTKRVALGACRRVRTGGAAAGGEGSRAGLGALRIKERNRKMKPRTDTHLALHPNPAPVDFNQMLGDRQTESRAAGFAGTRCIHAIEALEDPRLVGCGYPDAGVRDGEHYKIFFQFRTKNDFASWQRVLDGVIQQVLQNFLQPARVTRNVRQLLREPGSER